MKSPMPTIGRLRFVIPEGFVDRTNYTFSASGPEAISVDMQSDGLAEVSSERLLDRVASRFGRGSTTGVITAPKQSVVIDGREGQTMTIEAKEQRLFVALAAVTLEPSKAVLFSYMNIREEIETQRLWQHILSSVHFGREPQIEPEAGFYRARASEIVLDVPIRLCPPDVLIYASNDGIRLQILKCRPDGQRILSLHAWVSEHAARALSIDDLHFRKIAHGKSVGETASYLWRITGVVQFVLAGLLDMCGHQKVLLTIRGPSEQRARCEQAFDLVVRSFAY